MKAASLLKHIWIGCFMCALFLTTTGVAYAKATNCGGEDKAKTTVLEQEPVQKPNSVKNSPEAAVQPTGNNVVKSDAKPATVKGAEVKKEQSTNFFSFSFLYYLFYKTNFAETTNTAVRATWNAFVSSLLD